jgi:DNA polymerase III delta subunit
MSKQKATKEPSAKGLTPTEAKAVWKKNGLPRFILVVGTEEAWRKDALETIRSIVFDGKEAPEWLRVIYYGVEAGGQSDGEALTPATVLDEARTQSMFAAPGERKLIEVRRADEFFDKHREIWENNWKKIPASAVVVMAARQVKPGTRLLKTLAEQNAVVSCSLSEKKNERETEAVMASELEHRARALGLRLSPQAMQTLLNRAGQTLAIAEEELAKLALAYAADASPEKPKEVTPKQIEELCARTKLYGAFDWADAMSVGDLRKALETLGGIFSRGLGDYRRPGRVVTREGEIAMRLLGAATFKLLQMQDVRAGLDAGKPEQAALRDAKIFGPGGYFIMNGVRRHTSASLRKTVEALFQANMDLRSSQPPAVVMEKLTWAVCTANRRSS